MDLLRIAGLGTGVVGMAIAVIALVSLVTSRNRVPRRLRALGFVYLGMSLVCVAAVLFLLAAIGDARLPLVAAIVPAVIIGVTYFRLRSAYLRAFIQARHEEAPRHVTFTDAD